MPRSFRRGRRRYARRRFRTMRRGRRSFSRGRRGFRRRRWTRKSRLSITPQRKSVILRYVNTLETSQLAINNGNNSGDIIYCINDIYHFTRSQNAGVLAPNNLPMRDEWFEWFGTWRVNMVEFCVQLQNFNNPQSYYCHLILSPNIYTVGGFPATLGLTWEQIHRISRTNRWTVCKLIGPSDSGNSRVTMKLRIPIGKALGIGSNYRSDVDFWGIGGSTPGSPAKQIAAFLVMTTIDGNNVSADTPLVLNCYVNFYISMFSRQLEVA